MPKPTKPRKKKQPDSKAPKFERELTAEDDGPTAAEIAEEKERRRKESLERLKRVPPLYYAASGSFWFKPNHRFLEMSPARIKEHLKMRGLRDDVWFGGVKEIDWPFADAEASVEKLIDYAGSLAGHRTGIYFNQGKRYLVTEEAEGVWDDLPTQSEPPIFGPYIRALLPGDQWRRFCFWLAIAFRSLRNGDFKPGQVVWLCGPKNVGKSLCQLVVKLVLGGREANPFYYLFGSTDFNYDLMGAECWSFEDPPSQSDYKTRCEFGERLKECCNTDTIRGHRKNKDALVLRIFRRIIASINSMAEHLQRVPPMIDGSEDKNFLFKCSDARAILSQFIVKEEQQVMPGMGEPVPVGQQDRVALYKAVVAEIPLIRAWLLSEFKNVPPEWIEDRMGIVAWQHPELLAVINDMTPEAHLLCLIDQYWWKKNTDNFEQDLCDGTAGELYVELKEKTNGEVCSIVKNGLALGRYLARLKQLHPKRVSERSKGGHTHWTVSPPPQQTETEDNDEPPDNTQVNPAF